MRRWYKILLVLVLILTTANLIVSVNNNQDLRGGAAASETSMSVLPNTISSTAGQNFAVDIYVNTGKASDTLMGTEFKVNYDATKLKYISSAALNGYVVLNNKVDNGSGMMTLKMVTMGTELGAAVDVLRITFQPIAAGNGSLTVNGGVVMVSSQDVTWQVPAYNSSNFTISGGPTGNLSPTKIPTNMPTSKPSSTPTNKPTSGITVSPSVVPSGTITNGVLKFKISFAGVKSDAKCANNWPVEVTVMEGNGNSKLFSNLVLTPGGSSNGLAVYTGQITLGGINSKNNLAVFIKGPRHLQVKYAVNGQNYFYNKAGGQITVDADPNKTVVYDFTKYPLMAGDINRDGNVDGQDFSLAKTEVNKRSEGDNMAMDLNGNCKLESQDLAQLMVSMKDKQEQLY